MTPVRLAALALSLATVLLPLRAFAAGTPAVGFTSGAFGFEDNASDATGSPAGSFSLGFEFTANSPVFVNALGYFNDPSYDPTNPFTAVNLSPVPSGSHTSSSHNVGLYQVIPPVGALPETGLLLAQATITSASAPTGDFLYQSIAPIALITGNRYVVAGVTGPNDPYVFDVQDNGQPGLVGLTTSPSITYLQDRFNPSSSLAFPTQTDTFSEPGFLGPNLLLGAPSASSLVPESSGLANMTAAVLALGVSILFLRVRRCISRDA